MNSHEVLLLLLLLGPKLLFSSAITCFASVAPKKHNLEHENSSIPIERATRRSSIFSLSLDELAAVLGNSKRPKVGSAKVIWRELGKGNDPWNDDFSKVMSEKLLIKIFETFDPPSWKVLEEIQSSCGTRKLLIQLKDGFQVETVVIPSIRESRTTVCVSSQIGCNRACSFCATGKMGFFRNLTVEEIVGQVFEAKRTVRKNNLPDLKNVVFMGMGEPLNNLISVELALQQLSNNFMFAFGKSHISVSTVGPSPEAIRKMVNLPARLAWSVHAADDETRKILVPTTKHRMTDLRDAFNDVLKSRLNEHLFVEVTLLRDINDSLNHAEELAKLLRPLPGKTRINLLPYNDIGEITLAASEDESIEIFRRFLQNEGFVVTIRAARGSNDNAACGQLATAFKQKNFMFLDKLHNLVLMAHTLGSVAGAIVDRVKIKRALLSVSNKDRLIEFATFLADYNVELLSTGGTAKAIRAAGLNVQDVSDYTGHPEIMDGRVKTLHPKIHGGIMSVRGNKDHESDQEKLGIKNIDLVVLNLYPFEEAVLGKSDFDTCIENIDIGGPSMLRSSAKNHKYVLISTSPDQYIEIMDEMKNSDGATSLALRRRCAADAFALSCRYDASISSWISGEVYGADAVTSIAPRIYKHELPLKYGCNPHQSPAGIFSISGSNGLPFDVLNGFPGYINLMDAINAWQLVKELKESTGLTAASSFKHCSPAGASVAIPLSETEKKVYECHDLQEDISSGACAYIRARNADPMSSFGDFVAISDVVDEITAKILKREVSDGIIAPGFEPGALSILASKKGGKFIVLQAKSEFEAPSKEFREAYGLCFQQKRNDKKITVKDFDDVKTVAKLSTSAKRDLLVSTIAIKYTQSNSVAYAINGQIVGVGAGQQSRVDCVKLAARKVQVWYLRHHPKVQTLQFKDTVKRQDRVNARVRYIEGDITEAEKSSFESNFEVIPEPLTVEEKNSFMQSLKGVSLASDAFFPFRDSIDHASKVGVGYISQAGGSVCDDQVIAACDNYGISMAFTGIRLFHH